MKKGILLCGHGSRTQTGTEAFKDFVYTFKQRLSNKYEVDYGFLEFNHPIYEAAIERLYQKQVRIIYALPIILFAGAHAKNDIPYELNSIQKRYPDLTIKMGKHIGVSSYLLELAKKRILEIENTPSTDRRDMCLVVIGRGTTDPDANSDVVKLASMLGEGMQFGFTTVAYSGTAYPSIAETLARVDKLGFKQTIVIPFFFFTGILLERIYKTVEHFNVTAQSTYLYTKAFGKDELILKAFEERLEDIITGNSNMNCQLCKYRKQIVGFENEQHKEQIGHHLNVKGILFEEDKKIEDSAKPTPFSKIKKLLGI